MDLNDVQQPITSRPANLSIDTSAIHGEMDPSTTQQSTTPRAANLSAALIRIKGPAPHIEYHPGSDLNGGSNTAKFFIWLGFKAEMDSNDMWAELLEIVQQYVKDPRYGHVIYSADKPFYDGIVQDFLKAWGETFWGSQDRKHLQMEDPNQGYLCPRDTYRNDSRLVEVLNNLFRYKTGYTRYKNVIALNEGSTRYGSRANSGASPSKRTKRRRIATTKRSAQSCRPAVTATEGENEDDNIRHDGDDLDHVGGDRWTTPVLRDRRNRLRAEESPELEYSDIARTSSPFLKWCDTKQIYVPTRSATRRSVGTNNRVDTSTHEPAHSRASAQGRNIVYVDLDEPAEQSPLPQSENTIKPEPLSSEIQTMTILTVTASNQPSTMAPVTVSLLALYRFDELFDTLGTECGIHSSTLRKISAISATYTWSGKKHRIRKDKPKDWVIFCNALTAAWETSPDNFENGCEVEMLIHVDE